MRYVLVHETEDGPLVTGPLGGTLVYSDYDEAVAVARKKAKLGEKLYIQKLITVSVHGGFHV